VSNSPVPGQRCAAFSAGGRPWSHCRQSRSRRTTSPILPGLSSRQRQAHACRALCRARIAEELQRRRGTRIGEHLKLVLSIIDRGSVELARAPLPAALESSRRRTFLGREQAAGSLIVCLRGLCRFADMSGKRRPALKTEAQYSPHEETAKHRDLPKLFGQELQAHFKPLQDLPHRMFTLLMQLKNIRAPRK
jgi:hypothetical protein